MNTLEEISRSRYKGVEGGITEYYPDSSAIPCTPSSSSPASSFRPSIYIQPPTVNNMGEAKPGSTGRRLTNEIVKVDQGGTIASTVHRGGGKGLLRINQIPPQSPALLSPRPQPPPFAPPYTSNHQSRTSMGSLWVSQSQQGSESMDRIET